jgi:hypothetical protein
VVKHVKSNTIVLAKDKTVVGVGAGQMNRVDSGMLAIRQAKDKSAGSAMASDAFFPFPDNVTQAAKAGVRAIVQPGGSKQDQLSIDECDKHNIAMVFTGKRHFKHWWYYRQTIGDIEKLLIIVRVIGVAKIPLGQDVTAAVVDVWIFQRIIVRVAKVSFRQYCGQIAWNVNDIFPLDGVGVVGWPFIEAVAHWVVFELYNGRQGVFNSGPIIGDLPEYMSGVVFEKFHVVPVRFAGWAVPLSD